MKKRLLSIALALALCLAMLPMTALAADTTLEIEFVPITEDGFVADTMDGVDAIYDLSGGPLCSELIDAVGEKCLALLREYGLYQEDTP